MSLSPAAEEFEQIIRHQSAHEQVPFLLALEKKDVVAVREKLKSLKKELESIAQIAPNTWGSRGTSEQFAGMALSGFAVFSRREALSNLHRGWGLGGTNRKNYQAVQTNLLVILKAFRPDWLSDWLQARNNIAGGWGMDYALLRRLEEEQLVPHQPEVTARVVAMAIHIWGSELSDIDPVPLNSAEIIADKFRNDSVLLHRDLPLVFEFDTSILAGSGVRIQPPMPPGMDGLRAENGEYMYPWQVWNQQHPAQFVTWQDVFLRLVDSGHLDRADVITRCLLALRRDFRRLLLVWFKELFQALKPTLDERLANQAALGELLVHPLPLVANFAIDQLQGLLPEAGFSLKPLLLYADNLLTRPDLKTGIRALLASLLKLPRQNATHAPAVTRLLTTALPHPDGLVQERAAKGLAGILAAPQPLLSPAETAAAEAAISYHAELLGPAARTALANWLAPVAAAETAIEIAAYAPAEAFVPELSAATAITPVADWHELLFLTGQVLQHNDPAATERWLDGLLRLNGQLPTGYAGQLRPYLAQLFPQIKKASAAEAAILREPVDLYSHEGLVQAMLLTWATDFATRRVESVDVKKPHSVLNPLLGLEKQRYLLAEALLAGRQALPLLSTPTHQPSWVAPGTLITRLLAYQAAGTPPEPADLALALARTAHTHPTEAAEALRQLPTLADAGLRQLLAWFLGPAHLALPELPVAPAARLAATVHSNLAEALPELWAVATRTKAPAGVFPTLPAVLGYDYAGVSQPVHTTFEVVHRENNYPDPDQPGQTKTYRFVELSWSNGTKRAAPSALLLYAPTFGKSKYGSWEGNWMLTHDFPFLLALTPNYTAPLYEQILRSAAWADNLESSERDLIALALRALLSPGPAFGENETALLASGLIHNTALCRSLAQEVLLRAVANGRLQPGGLGGIIGQQLAVGYAPVPRLSTVLTTLVAVDALADDALCQLLEALLPELPATPPRNTRKLLELYASLRDRTRRAIPAEVNARFSIWKSVSSLKTANRLLA
ncbi:DUF6493 family protein [Hymenobacter negativus]|uniref:HEAT repeat domain-containing protein n=1 Tax=Hymenobacter negativus TaxID=2795026 RepID=A0ABS3QIR3_9BACT|nr:DUF6493 family protein [Hymenobacter negativus]MBO2011126.1 hypothetical protein [Hymenobacter negativus]